MISAKLSSILPAWDKVVVILQCIFGIDNFSRFSSFNKLFSKWETMAEIACPIAQLTPQVADMMAMLCFSFSSYRDPQLFTTTLQGVTSKWRRLTTVYQGLSIRFRRALTLLRGNDRVTAKSWSTTRGRGANYAAREGKFLLSNMALFYFTICLSTASTVLLAFWYCSCSLKVFTLENASQNLKNYY